jgi:hypothetical protein
MAMNSKRGDRAASAPVKSDAAGTLFGPLAMALLEEGPAICVTDTRGRRLFANKPYERIAAA